MPAFKRTYSSRRSTSVSDPRRLKRSNAMPMYRSLTVNSNPSGVVAAKSTDLARTRGPFAPSKWMSLEYSNALTAVVPGAATVQLSVACNSLYDFDKSGSYFGNKQPLYFDALMSATGPYKTFKVESWVTVFTIINNTAVPVSIFGLPPASTTAELDLQSEVDNWPGVQRLYLTSSSGSKNIGTITMKGHIKDLFPTYMGDTNLSGNYGGDPAAIAYGGLFASTVDGTTVLNLSVAVKHVFHAELGNIDAIVS